MHTSVGKDIRVTLNVSGIMFQIKREILMKKPDSYLGQLAINVDLKNTRSEIWIDRPIESFEAILAFYQTDELHMPASICPKAFKAELEFWRIPYTDLEECCRFKYLQFMEDLRLKTDFVKQQTKLVKEHEQHKSKIRSKVWRIIDNREKSVAAKIFLLVGISFVLASAISMSINTLPQHRRSLTPCEIQSYYKEEFDSYIEEETKFLSVDCKAIRIHDDHIEVGDVTNFSKPPSLPTITVKNDAFMTIEYITTSFFTLEILVRLFCCPNLKLYFLSWINIADIISLMAGYMNIILYHITDIHDMIVMKDVLEHLQILRLLRLVRYCQHFSTIQVLKFSLLQNFRDLLVLLLYLGIGILIFANIVYLLEENYKINNIPQAWWLGIITMTTVGYGDITPVTSGGKVVCGLCALSGVILISIILPIFVDSFLALYGIAQLNIRNDSNTTFKLTCKDKNKDKIFTTKVVPVRK